MNDLPNQTDPAAPGTDDLVSQHGEMSKIVRTMLFSVVVYCLFCGLTLGQSNKTLFAADAAIQLPFANVNVSYAAFLVIGPLVLVAMAVYMHIFIGSMTALGSVDEHKKLPFIFNLGGALPRAITNILFYLLPPLLLTVFSLKAQPHPYFPYLAALTVLFAFAMVVFKHQETPEHRRYFHWFVPVVLGGFLWVNYDFVESDLFDRLNLANADLRNARLDRFDLRYVDLKNARMDSASLNGTRLNGAWMSGASLVGAEMRSADMSDSELHNADFSGATLIGATLIGANLISARLVGARLDSGSTVGGEPDRSRPRRGIPAPGNASADPSW